ncbi:MAG: radical SAM protein [Myxococcaceae bacterium]|jgi:pyruvate-formate lyase-activating enzyme|nr:radical SAM protein [Myxococcaceae bacterium]MCA3012576.1 radical SAM protein [Myxococcaceae bacterium]
MPAYKLLLADPKGRVIEHPWLLASLRSDEAVLPPRERPIPLPDGGKLAHLPGRLPVGFDPTTKQPVLVERFELDGKRFVPHAVGATLPPGFTRTYLPGEVAREGGPVLPQWAYTAAAWGDAGPVVWALHTDRRKHWTPARFSTPEVKRLVAEHLARLPGNRVVSQLKTCALVYRCFTSQNIFYSRDEGALPASVMCNAACVGCISDQPEGGPPASHERMADGPSANELADVASWHLEHAPGRTMVSFGQGCEGEPLTRWRFIAEAIGLIRARTSKGSININTNGSLTKGLDALFDAGLDAVRVSLNSAVKELYEAYYQPRQYGWEDVEASIALARRRGAYVALNLLLFPGVTDRQGEADALVRLIKKYRVDQVQTRPLAIDPLQYIAVARGRGAGGAPIGISNLVRRFKAEAPWVTVGNFARGLGERRRRK